MNFPSSITNLTPVEYDPFAGSPILKLIPAVEPQVEIFVACLLGGEDANRSYNESVSLRLSGPFNHQAMIMALQELTKRHEALRSNFSADGKNLFIFDELPLSLSTIDLSGQPSNEQDQYIHDFSHKNATTAFDLLNGPLFKAAIIKLSKQEHYLNLSAHHIICDGWSFGILMEDLSQLYSAYAEGLEVNMGEAESFSQFAFEQHEFYQSGKYEQIGEFWVNIYKKDIPVLSLPTDFNRPALRTYKANRDDYPLDKQLATDLKKIGAKAGCSFVTTLLSAFQFYVHRLTGQNKIIVGLPAAGQPATGYPGLIGHCVNLLPLRSEIETGVGFIGFLKKQKSLILDAYDHQLYTFGSLLKKLHLQRDASRIPLVPVIFNVDAGMDNKVKFYQLSHQRFSNPREYENFELFLNLNGSEGSLILEWSYNSQLFKASTIRQMMEDLTLLLRSIVNDPSIRIEDVSITSSREIFDNLLKWNNTTAAYPKEKPLHELFREQAKKSPANLAIIDGDNKIAYHELDQLTNRFAALLQNKNIQIGDTIAVALDRSPQVIITLLAILKSGAAYVPLDPDYPKERVELMLQDSSAKILITSKKYRNYFQSNARELLIEEIHVELLNYPAEDLLLNANGSDLAYILYTSGSTGKPKGVQVEHHNLVNFLCSMKKNLSVSEQDHLLAVTTISFDISGLELYLPLICGASLTIVETDTARDGRLLLNLIKKEKPSIMQATPSTWQMLIEVGFEKGDSIKTICCGGEALNRELANALLARCTALFNLYGPTETTIWSTTKRIESTDETITVGFPIDNTQVYILDELMNPVSEGITGEIYLAGEGVARGYLNRPELTLEKFVSNPFSEQKGDKMYRTGDLGKYLANGEIQCLGRIDHQVKIRGHRIELEEIEHCLLSQEPVKQAIVLARELRKNDHRLVAYIVPHKMEGETAGNEMARTLKQAMLEKLPAYMIPNDFVFLQVLPVTPNGKIDRKALPEPGSQVKEVARSTVPSTNEEKIVARIWKEVLGLVEVGIDDDFFELGGHSMIAVQMMTRLEKETGIHLPVAILFEHSTVEQLASFLKVEDKDVAWDCLVPIKASGTKMSLYMIHGIGGTAPFMTTKLKELDPDQPIFGIQARGLNGKGKIVETIEEMATLYINAILKQNPTGPYALAGYSFGGFVAYEMAQQLHAMGKEVKMLGILDTYAGNCNQGNSIANKIFNGVCHFFRRTAFTWNLFIQNPQKKIAFEKNELRKKLRASYYGILKAAGKKRVNYFHYKNLVTQNNLIALRKYKLRLYDGIIYLFRSRDPSYYIPDMEYLGWNEFAGKGVKIYELPGEHNTIFSPENDSEVAKVLQNCLDEL